MKNTYKTILDKSSAKWILALIAVVGFVITIYTSFFNIFRIVEGVQV